MHDPFFPFYKESRLDSKNVRAADWPAVAARSVCSGIEKKVRKIRINQRPQMIEQLEIILRYPLCAALLNPCHSATFSLLRFYRENGIYLYIYGYEEKELSL